MNRKPKTLIAALATGLIATSLIVSVARAKDGSSLMGDWRSADGSITARMAACPTGGAVCATVVAERPAPGDPSAIGQVWVRDLQPEHGGWRGTYGAGGTSLPARIRLIGPDRLELRVCANAVLCETARYDRVRR